MVETTYTKQIITQHNHSHRAAPYATAYQTVYLILGLIEGSLLLSFLFRLLGANPLAGIVRLSYTTTDVLMRPFRFIFPTTMVAGTVFDWSIFVAMLTYALVAWIILKLISISYTVER